MAQPIRLELPPRDPRVILQSRLQNAPVEHAEAILSAYEVLQGLHDRGALELLRGALGSSDEVLEIAVDAANSPQSIRGIRNLILLVNMFGEIEPDVLKALTLTIPQALKSIGEQQEPLGLWRLATEFLRNQDTRRGLSALTTVLETLGRNLANKAPTE